MSSPEPSTKEDLRSTSYVLNSIDESLRPKKQVACMTCPLAVWMLKSETTLECYCRTLYMVVWETTKPGKITMCDAPEQARLAAESATEPTRSPTRSAPTPSTSTASTASPFQPGENGDTFGLLTLGGPENPEHEYL